jgi:hypothetical protein
MNRWKLAAGAPLALVLGVSLSSTACLEPTAVDAAGSCVASVRVQGTLYHLGGTASVPDGFDPDTPYATVSEYRKCVDVIVYAADEPTYERQLGDGESNYLAVGTPLYAVPGVDPGTRLVVRGGDGSWLTWLAEGAG